jgi:sigma-E factor negative regulatory protein RseA
MSEQFSEMLDGEVEQSELAKHLTLMLSNKTARAAYRDYQLIGEAMRGTYHYDDKLTQSIMDKIDLEPTILSPSASLRSAESTVTGSQLPDNVELIHSNSHLKFLPRAWSIAASVAAVMVVGLFVVNQEMHTFMDQSTLAVAQHDEATLNGVNQATTALTPAMIPEEYLRAHRVSAPSVGSHYIQAVNYTE